MYHAGKQVLGPVEVVLVIHRVLGSSAIEPCWFLTFDEKTTSNIDGCLDLNLNVSWILRVVDSKTLTIVLFASTKSGSLEGVLSAPVSFHATFNASNTYSII